MLKPHLPGVGVAFVLSYPACPGKFAHAVPLPLKE